MRRDLCGGLLGTGGYDLRCRLSRLRTGWGRLSLGWRLLGGGLGLRLLGGSLGLCGNLSGGLLWTGGYDLRGRLS